MTPCIRNDGHESGATLGSKYAVHFGNVRHKLETDEFCRLVKMCKLPICAAKDNWKKIILCIELQSFTDVEAKGIHRSGKCIAKGVKYSFLTAGNIVVHKPRKITIMTNCEFYFGLGFFDDSCFSVRQPLRLYYTRNKTKILQKLCQRLPISLPKSLFTNENYTKEFEYISKCSEQRVVVRDFRGYKH